ncbi:MAG TPA: LL-diaminopimelate aminotransferase [Spirochaetia bacterium]|nr:LL-diaminopimelate aminotransferase [Spirochaetia bacterium]
MVRINEHYLKLQSSYLFSTIGRKVQEYQTSHPDASIIRLGIGDVTRALPATIIEAYQAGVAEMGHDATFRGYGPEQGYEFLRSAIAAGDYRSRGVQISAEDIFISDGAKCDTGNIQELFAADSIIAVPDPVYPVYVDTNVMAGRAGSFADGRYKGLTYLDSTSANGYVPAPPETKVDIVYLCFPNNPTGATATRDQLAAWVEYAKKHRALILFDAAYEAYIRDPEVPHSIYEIPGAKEVAIEFRSFSKTAGFTGVRCAFTVVPQECMAYDETGSAHSLRTLWNRRQTTKFNGVSYPVQRAAAAVYSATGAVEVRELVDYYLENARLIRTAVEAAGYHCEGGLNSPYIWVETGTDSWAFFDRLLSEAQVVCTPGAGFGLCGEGHIRISAFNHREKVVEALERLSRIL